MNRNILAIAALGSALAASCPEAAIVRGGGSTTNDPGHQFIQYYITPTLETHPDPLDSFEQSWISNLEIQAVPIEAEIDPDHDGLEVCVASSEIFCDYSIGAGESRRLAVTAGTRNGIVVSPLAIPTLDIFWRVLDLAGVHKTFEFLDHPYPGIPHDFELVMNGLPARTYTLEVEARYSLPVGYEFYETTGGLVQGDVRTVGSRFATNLGRVISVTGRTFLHIDPDSVPADEFAPVSAASAVPGPNAQGWNRTPVQVTITAADEPDGSGLAFIGYQIGSDADTSPVSPVMFTIDTEGTHDIAYFAEDEDGNRETTKHLVVKLDLTNPTIGAAESPPANIHGWNDGPVTVNFSCADALSGIASCTGPVTFSLEGAGQTAEGSAVDKAGNSAGASKDVNIDTTAPLIDGTASPAPNAAGWNNSNVTVSFDCSDALSGIASCTADQTLSSNGADQSVAGEAVDKAGNSAGTTVADIDIDKVPPDVDVTGVSDGAVYIVGSVPAAGCSTTDPLSGVKSAASLSLTGGTPNGVGNYTADCTGAMDNADNPGSASASYEVHYDYSGFFSPVDNPPVVNSANGGQSIPVKFSLAGAFGLDILAGNPQSQKVSCAAGLPLDPIEETAIPGASTLSYDPQSDQYTYVWKTLKSYKGSCRTLYLSLDDGTVHTAFFTFK